MGTFRLDTVTTGESPEPISMVIERLVILTRAGAASMPMTMACKHVAGATARSTRRRSATDSTRYHETCERACEN